MVKDLWNPYLYNPINTTRISRQSSLISVCCVELNPNLQIDDEFMDQTMGFLQIMLLGLSDIFMANVYADILSVDEMRPFRLITEVDLVKNASFEVSLAQIALNTVGTTACLELRCNPSQLHLPPSISLHTKHIRTRYL